MPVIDEHNDNTTFIPFYSHWKSHTATNNIFHRRGGAINTLDREIKRYNDLYASGPVIKLAQLVQIEMALTAFKTSKNAKYIRKSLTHGYRFSARHDENKQLNFDTLGERIEKERARLQRLKLWSLIETTVANRQLLNIKVADIQFSANVKAAARSITCIDGRTLHQTVHDDFFNAAPVAGNMYGHNPFKVHESALNTELRAAGGGRYNIAALQRIAAPVLRFGFGVCESMSATVISELYNQDPAVRYEEIGIKYSARTGHAIVVVGREPGSDIYNVASWGPGAYIIDLWNFALKFQAQWRWRGSKALKFFFDKEMRGSTLKSMADINPTSTYGVG